MISNDLALVLGAGASLSYGFPTGDQLRRYITEEIRPDGLYDWLYNELASEEIDRRHLVAFIRAFRSSQIKSIDEFLTNRSEFVELGKMCIAGIIKACEDRSLFTKQAEGSDHWYQEFWSALHQNSNWDTFKNNKVSVVTFNYDRSLEEYLVNAMCHSFNKAKSECRGLLSSVVKIVHIYGSVGGEYGDLRSAILDGGADPEFGEGVF